ncbi:MAG: Ribonuclease [Candidatus Saccharibacteria bacterium]|jgi:membrane protein|nr:Ribonuclease [Candidatus Saccharibacteria bacterium]
MKNIKFAVITYLSLIAFIVGNNFVKGNRTQPQHVEADQDADSPPQLSSGDWKQALKETKDALKNKSLPMLAAGVAFFTTLSFFPMLAAGVAIVALVIDQGQISQIIASLDNYLPKDLASLISTQLQTLSGKDTGNILMATFAILLSLYSASAATQNLINATNRSYDVDESRGFIKVKLLSLALTLIGLLLTFTLIPLLLITTDFLNNIGIPESVATTIIWLRWPLILAIITIALAAFYRYGPDRKDPKWQWVSWGAGAATLIWLIGTALFFLYAQNYGSFSESYGVFAGIIILMTWLNLSAFIFLLGAEVNHRLERQTDAPTLS